jgi:cell division protein FtsW
MPLQLDRRNTSMLGRWWWTVDKPLLFAIMALVCLGVFMVAAGSPPVAARIGLPDFYFVTRHQMFLGMSVVVMIGISMLSHTQIKRIALLGLVCSVVIMMLLPFIGFENKGAVRWLRVAGMSLQPSEFMKPCFAVIIAWIFAHGLREVHFRSYRAAMSLYAAMVVLLIIQPDFGMVVTITGTFAVQFFLAGMPFLWVIAMGVLGVAGVVAAYQSLPHVASRIDRFLNPASGDNYQVKKSLDAFANGRWFGTGPGEGTVKQSIPDSHTDFIFAVAGEEFGVIFCLGIIALFATIVLRGFSKLWQETDQFCLIAVGGLLAQFGVQAIINMGVAVNLLPAKGMTLPFLSYGGSSLVAMALGMGMILGLSRKRYGQSHASPAQRARVKVRPCE